MPRWTSSPGVPFAGRETFAGRRVEGGMTEPGMHFHPTGEPNGPRKLA